MKERELRRHADCGGGGAVKQEEEVRVDFESDVAEHKMTVKLDHGVYRHLRFGRPATVINSFHIITYPGGLLFRGDRGDYVFERTEDMFDFFRGSRRIDPSYWGEKVTAQDKGSPVKGWSWQGFAAEAREALEDYLVNCELSEDWRVALWGELEDEVIGSDDQGRDHHIEAIREFEVGGRCPFRDAWEWSCEEYSYQFLWCCHAILWAVGVWDVERERVGLKP